MSSFEIGKAYKPVDADEFFPESSALVMIGRSFVCHHIDPQGDCWSMDVTYKGNTCMDGQGWCVASQRDLKKGRVIAA